MGIENTKRILLVEDEAAVSMLIEDMITDLGHEVVGPAYRFDLAMGMSRSDGFDIAVLDISLGDRVVYPVADLLRSRAIPFVFSTGYSRNAVPERFKGIPVLCKPFSLDEFSHVLEGLADREGPARSALLPAA